MGLRLTLLWVVALIAMFAIGAPTALAGDDSDLAEPVADTTPTPPPTASEPAPQAVPDADAGQSSQNPATSGASNNGAVSQGANQAQPSAQGGSGQSQQLAQDANIDQAADSEANAQQQATNANVPAGSDDGGSGGGSSAEQQLDNEARSEASNQAEIDQTAQQDQAAEGGGAGGTGQSQQLEQNAAVDQQADSGANADQEATNVGGPDGAEQELENEAESDASNEAEVEQDAQQEQSGGGGPGGGGSGQVQQAEQNAEINQSAQSEAVAQQEAINAPPVDTAAPDSQQGGVEVDWAAILNQLPFAGGVEEIIALAQNGSLVFQAIWQVQQGCNNHCTGTSQSQSASQHASTTQDATAVADGVDPNEAESSGGAAAPSTAEARNRSVTVQFVWQTQIGCVAFCVETSQTQTANQWAQTNQSANSDGGTGAVAENLSETLQLVWQLQEGCQEECYGTSQVQVINQGQETNQSASARSGTVLVPILGPDGTVVLPGWLVALAENLGVTIQTIYQLQEAVCAEYCEGDSQVQDAVQRADVSQEAAAHAGDPPVPVEEPPSGEPPTQQPPATQPPGQQPGPATLSPASSNGAGALAAISDPSSPTSRRLRSQLTKLASRGHKSQLRSLVVVLPSNGKAAPPQPSGNAGQASGITAATFGTPFTAIGSTDPSARRPAQSAAGQASDSLSPTTFGVAPDDPTDGGPSDWLWVALLAATIALLLAARPIALLRPRMSA
jgi:hypothetical protein